MIVMVKWSILNADKLPFGHHRPPGGVANAALPACRSSRLVRPSRLPAVANCLRMAGALATRATIALGGCPLMQNSRLTLTSETSTIELLICFDQVPKLGEA